MNRIRYTLLSIWLAIGGRIDREDAIDMLYYRVDRDAEQRPARRK